jgi:hypothetical protein
MSHREIREGAGAMAIWPAERALPEARSWHRRCFHAVSTMPDVSSRSRHVGQEEAMFGFRTTFCVLGGHRVSKSDAVPVLGRKDIGVCGACRARWHAAGSVCARCKSPVLESHDLGLFLDRYALGHRHCGATLVGEVYVGV